MWRGSCDAYYEACICDSIFLQLSSCKSHGRKKDTEVFMLLREGRLWEAEAWY